MPNASCLSEPILTISLNRMGIFMTQRSFLANYCAYSHSYVFTYNINLLFPPKGIVSSGNKTQMYVTFHATNLAMFCGKRDILTSCLSAPRGLPRKILVCAIFGTYGRFCTMRSTYP
ncbi:hypothetical protein T4A_3907 [Trichinella pseudospiralis]|uniref:Uncharacterized protein n=1 Tax=Trichinella pseudospiralis TaxID=6337 RepID=A0A0V1EIT8_TRIPS|nr:hypothetical protein T4A_3907 [Trichinella pseudospiralis]